MKRRFTDQLEGLIFAIIIVLEFPPSESWKEKKMKFWYYTRNSEFPYKTVMRAQLAKLLDLNFF